MGSLTQRRRSHFGRLRIATKYFIKSGQPLIRPLFIMVTTYNREWTLQSQLEDQLYNTIPSSSKWQNEGLTGIAVIQQDLSFSTTSGPQIPHIWIRRSRVGDFYNLVDIINSEPWAGLAANAKCLDWPICSPSLSFKKTKQIRKRQMTGIWIKMVD